MSEEAAQEEMELEVEGQEATDSEETEGQVQDEDLDSQEESEEDETGEDESEKEDPEEEEEEEPPLKPKKKLTFEERQQQLNQQIWEKRETERRIEEKLQRVEAATQQLESKMASQGKPKPNADDYESYEDYTEALTDWKVEQKLLEREAKQKTPKQEEVPVALQNYGMKRQEAMSKHKDYEFHEKVVTTTIGRLGDKAQEVSALIIESDHSTEIVQYLGGNMKELDRISKLSPLSIAKEIAKIEGKMSTPRKKKPGAPRPPSHLKGGSGQSNVTSTQKGISAEEWIKRRNKELAGG